MNAIREAFPEEPVVRLYAFADSADDVDDDPFLARRHQGTKAPGHIDITEDLQIPDGAPASLVHFGDVAARDGSGVVDEEIGLGTFRGEDVDALAV